MQKKNLYKVIIREGYMRRKTRTKVKKYLKIVGIIIGVILLIVGIFFAIKLSRRPEISYEDGIIGKNPFIEITIDLANKEVKRDNVDSSLRDEFNITEEQENLAYASVEEMQNLLSNSVFDISIDGQKFTIKNKYQTKKFIVEASEIKQKVEGEEITELSDSLYLLSFYSEKLTKAMYNYYQNQEYIKQIYNDEIFIDEPINDISQTVYGNSRSYLNWAFIGINANGVR